MKILDIAYDARFEHNDGPYIHTISLAEKLAELVSLNLIIRSNNLSKPVMKKFGNLTLHLFPFKDIQKLSFINKLFYITSNNLKLISYVLRNWQNYDVIYERHNLNMVSGLILSKIKRIPLIYEINGIPDEDVLIVYGIKNRILKMFFKLLCAFQLKNADKIIVQTEELKSIILKRFGCKKIFVVSNGVEIPKTGKLIKKPGTPLKFIFSGSLDEQHDITPMLKVMSSFPENFILEIVGTGPLLKNLRLKFIKEKRFKFRGKVKHEKSLDLISKADICLVYYNKEYKEFKIYGFYYCPIKLLEYASFGKPIVVLNMTNSILKYFEENRACMIISDIKKQETELLSLMKNPRKLKKIGKNALKLVQKYTWGNAAVKTLEIIKA